MSSLVERVRQDCPTREIVPDNLDTFGRIVAHHLRVPAMQEEKSAGEPFVGVNGVYSNDDQTRGVLDFSCYSHVPTRMSRRLSAGFSRGGC